MNKKPFLLINNYSKILEKDIFTFSQNTSALFL